MSCNSRPMAGPALNPRRTSHAPDWHKIAQLKRSSSTQLIHTINIFLVGEILWSDSFYIVHSSCHVLDQTDKCQYPHACADVNRYRHALL